MLEQGKALITGASSGIGLELARQFARHGHPLILTAPVESELDDIARELEAETRTSVRVIAHDLEKENAARDIYEGTLSEPQPVEILVNNAGAGHLGRFWEVPMDSIISMIRLNVEAVVRLTRAASDPP